MNRPFKIEKIQNKKHWLLVNAQKQSLTLYQRQKVQFECLVSTAKNGVGQQFNSYKTPLGWHKVRAKIGASMPNNTVFVGRRPTGEYYSEQLANNFPQRDWILTRILWLSGLEVGKNRLGNVDTMRRYIYIHGSPDERLLGKPSSKGCICMHNQDLITLFDLIGVGIPILIKEK